MLLQSLNNLIWIVIIGQGLFCLGLAAYEKIAELFQFIHLYWKKLDNKVTEVSNRFFIKILKKLHIIKRT